jgi:predicted DNA-binding protein
MKRPKRTALVGIRLTEEEYNRLKFAAKISGKTPSTIAYQILTKGLEA